MEKFVDVMDIAELPVREMLSILRQGSVLRLPHLEGRLRQAREHVNRFEAAYGMTLDELRTQGLPDDADYRMHEDFIEWEYWHDVLNETELVVTNVKKILTKAEEVSVLP
jgi:hypothetical protein